MRTEHLEHKHGGRILSIDGIEHETYKGVASWEYVGTVEWEGGSISERAHIAPWAVCYDHDNPNAAKEYVQVSERLARYLDTHGKWHDTKVTRDCRHYRWTPHKKKFSEVFADECAEQS